MDSVTGFFYITMIKGEIKVIHGIGGSRVQEELNGEIKIYSPEAWKEELAVRMEDDKKEREKGSKTVTKEKAPSATEKVSKPAKAVVSEKVAKKAPAKKAAAKSAV